MMANYSETVKIVGLDATLAALKRLPSVLGKGPVRGALYAASKVMKDAAIENAPVNKKNIPTRGLLKRSIYTYYDRKSRNGDHRYFVGVRSNRRRGRGSLFGSFTAGAYYWHFVEFGTVKQRGQFYMTRAFLLMGKSAVQKFERELAKLVDASVVKARGRSR